MFIDVGTLRFALPDGTRDRSTYIFRGPGSAQVTLELEPMLAAATPQEVFARRLTPIESFLGHAVAADDREHIRPELVVRTLDLSEIDVFCGFVIGPASSDSAFVLKYASKLDLAGDDAFFRHFARSISPVGGGGSVCPPKWIPREALSVNFALPADFLPTVVFAYEGPEWFVSLRAVNSLDSRWTGYFSDRDEVTIKSSDTRTVEFGRVHQVATETVLRLARSRSALDVDGVRISPAIDDEHAVREVVLKASEVEDIRLFAAGGLSATPALDEIWTLLQNSTELRPK